MKKTKLLVFDFDSTLVFTPGPETLVDGVPALECYDAWLLNEGLPKRKFSGWWGRKETLCPPIFGKEVDGVFVPPPELLNEEIAALSREGMKDPANLTVLMTGRHFKMKCPVRKEHHVRLICDAYGLEFDRYYYVCAGQDTLQFKCNTIEMLLREFPTIRAVEIWEDRVPHVSSFYDFMKYLKSRDRLDDYKVHQVYPPTPEFVEEVIDFDEE